MAIMRRPVLVAVSAHGSARAELRARIHDAFDDGEQVESRAGEAVDPSNRHHIAGLNAFEEFQQLASVGAGAALLLAVNLRASWVELTDSGDEARVRGSDCRSRRG